MSSGREPPRDLSPEKAAPVTPLARKRERLLDPVERLSEVVFGVLMALSITGSFSVASAGREEISTLTLAALGCNLAWGLTDAVMFLVGTATERRRNISLLRKLHVLHDLPEAHRLIAGELPERLSALATPALEAIRVELISTPLPSSSLERRDFLAAFAVFGMVVLATFPVVIPFFFFADAGLALRASNLCGLLTLFAGGCVLGRYAEHRPLRYGLMMAAIGAALVLTIIALGG